MRDDFAHFFEKKQFYAWDSSIANRSMAWEAWIESRVTFFEALCLMLPAWMQPRSLRGRFLKYKKISAKRLCLFYLESDGSFYLQGQKFLASHDDYEKLIHAMRAMTTERKTVDVNALLNAGLIIPHEAV
jgi:hypothetical protein